MKNLITYCQSCHMPITNEKDFGTEMGGALNRDYCHNCYQNGGFTNPFMTLHDMQTHVRQMLERRREDERVIHYEMGTLCDLKRWYHPDRI